MRLNREAAAKIARTIVADNCREHGEDFVSEGMTPGDGMIERITTALLAAAGGEAVAWGLLCETTGIVHYTYPDRAFFDNWLPRYLNGELCHEDGHRVVPLGIIASEVQAKKE